MTAPEERSPLRYAPESPLPTAAYVPGRTRRPEPEGTGAHAPHASHAADGGPAGPADGLAESLGFRFGVDLFNHGFYWEAHEEWETLWLPIPRGSLDAALLQGLIQGAAALLKLRTGAAGPARTIWARGRARLAHVAASSAGGKHLGVPLASLLAALDRAIDAGELPEPPPRIRLA